MTTHYMSRCIHCGTVYDYQASGWGADEYNNGNYCPRCWKAICDTLATIPEAVETVWEPTTEYTAQQLKEIEDRRFETTREEGKIPMRRVYAPLFDLNDPSNTNHVGITTISGVTYKWSFWSKRDDAEVYRKMEKDVATGVTQLWRNCRKGR